ncbi:DUF5970 family protein [Paenibacillus larvae]|uniref:Uncharacterized protein n=4 Tax=Paenibacillus larvae TaxID=1464 RepID=V9WB28_9BACL|nr:DUF5970 family protein [Paenibacillus larvae]AHD07378.1 hypothetical protein ERIC2_c36620 [Paenibacillus larvae subsp. larvae DSM 25430]AQR79155.1 hypothetical protein BXP28_19935 [Paenibacillus larvae subsp. larvae]AQT85502.1 hypothetical protein B1222_15600 [Paenibacillus larvae subsp. pulvifaciens]AQZ47513.1 hypothetical protein B5S25_13945 [Paenibacillus larvae subsp. pulvifaciens]ARF68815.1 hypothetical protein B7C51_14970 [Paenibacillus larvae subsp. pulvifaciens]
MGSNFKHHVYLVGIPVILFVGYLISLTCEFLLPLLTFGLAGLYLFVFAPVQNKIAKSLFLLIFILNLLGSIALYLNI